MFTHARRFTQQPSGGPFITIINIHRMIRGPVSLEDVMFAWCVFTAEMRECSSTEDVK